MNYKYRTIFLCFILLLAYCVILFQCTTKVEPNPDPGVIRIYLVTNPADTCIQIGFDSLVVSSNDQFVLIVSQMKAYTNDTNYVRLYKNFSGYQDEDISHNLLERRLDKYVPQMISETYVPPNNYKKLEFVIYPSETVTIQGLTFPIEIPDDYDPLIIFDHSFTIKENQEYDIYIQFNAFQSITRWRDIYIFTPDFEIINY